MDPDVFHEIVSFLRARRIRPSARSSFGIDAEDLGLPVHHVKGSRTVSFRRVGEYIGNHLAFRISLRSPGRARTHSLSFGVSEACMCTVFTKPGRFDDALATRESWNQVWQGNLKTDCLNTVPVAIWFEDLEPHSVYISCGERCLLYSGEDSN